MVNEDQKLTRVVSSRLTFVPYKARYVEKYHAWMKDEQIQYLTGSEPLSLEEEYEMQKKWSRDEDKCTFIILDNQLLGSMAGGSGSGGEKRGSTDAENGQAESTNQSMQTNQAKQTSQVVQTSQLASSTSEPPEDLSANEIRSMIGDTNLFLNNCDAPDEAEIEIMIAEPTARRKGLGREALRMMIKFAFERLQLNRLIAKIKQDNQVSIVLFKSLGFEEVSKSDVFQEFTFQLNAGCSTVKRVLEIAVTYRPDSWE